MLDDCEVVLLGVSFREFRCSDMVFFVEMLSRVLARISALPPAHLDGELEWNIDDSPDNTRVVFLVVE